MSFLKNLTGITVISTCTVHDHLFFKVNPFKRKCVKIFRYQGQLFSNQLDEFVAQGLFFKYIASESLPVTNDESLNKLLAETLCLILFSSYASNTHWRYKTT